MADTSSCGSSMWKSSHSWRRNAANCCGAVLATPDAVVGGTAVAVLPAPSPVAARPGGRRGLGLAAPALLAAAKLLPLLKFSKVLLTTGSMLLSVGVYAISFGLPAAV